MTVRKITIDSSVGCISKDDNLHSEQPSPVKPNMRKKNVSNKKFSQNRKKFFNNITAERFPLLRF